MTGLAMLVAIVAVSVIRVLNEPKGSTPGSWSRAFTPVLKEPDKSGNDIACVALFRDCFGH